MNIILNGAAVHTAATTISALVAELTDTPDGLAVAVDGQVVPRSQWSQTLSAGAQVEVVGAVQGG